ncbi:MAG: hypothetical protein AWU57_586 [Marinobacter sp. T13-3]|nr:MAG: hypothetical protein AWU57_586 [Marinobacter sp. T13-3]
MTDKTDRLEHFDRALKTLSAHFARHGKQGTKATPTRTLECAFETDSDFSDAMAASLMLKAETSPNLKAGLDGWKVFEQQVWLDAAKRHEGRTLAEIRQSL